MPATHHLPFSHQEYARRLSAVRDAMRQREADVLLVDETEHLGYLTGYQPRATRYQVCVVPLEGDPIMLARSIDEPTFREQSWLTECDPFGDDEDPVKALQRTLASHGWAQGSIALELDSHYLTVQRYQAIKAALPRAHLVDFSNVLWDLRVIKSPEEIAMLRRAAEIVDRAMASSLEAVREGASERAAAIAAYTTALTLGADNSWMSIVASGDRTTSIHGTLHDRRLQAGDLVHIELAPQVNGYSARIMRPAVIGRPAPEVASTARTLVQIQDLQIATMRPGVVARDVDRVAREEVLARGLRARFDNVTGYTLGYIPGIGAPRTSDFTRVFLPNAEWKLQPGMVFHMYLMARGMGFSETVLVTDSAAERLTHFPRNLPVR